LDKGEKVKRKEKEKAEREEKKEGRRRKDQVPRGKILATALRKKEYTMRLVESSHFTISLSHVGPGSLLTECPYVTTCRI